ncbi:MAG: hypothetical protein ACD_33C00045G0032 [uncultured bacterium]|nr:MAG: hypothetical protein ACD_33C00045G0032 [uncultured bacterium]
MPITLKLTNFNDIYNNIEKEKIIINDIDIFNNENKKLLDNIIFKNYTEDNISIIPSCNCGEIKGTYYTGEKCEACDSFVTSSVDDNISFLLWAKRPEGVERFISPIVLGILLERYKLSKPTLQVIRWLMLPNYKIDKRQYKDKITSIDNLADTFAKYNIKRGYNNFIENFDTIIEILEATVVTKINREKSDSTVEFLIANKDKFFSDYLPFPNRVLFVTETNELGKFIDKSLLTPVNVIRRLTGIDLHYKPNSIKQNRIAISLIDLAIFYKDYMKNTFFNKNGLVRQHISSTRSHFTARAVATSIPGPHAYDELYMPWGIACSLLREHILNKLFKRGYIYKDAINFLVYHNKIYHPVLDDIFQELIRDSGNGIKVLVNRNPSLHRGSIQLTRVTRIKVDPSDFTFSISYLIAKAFNLDYDGRLHCRR